MRRVRSACDKESSLHSHERFESSQVKSKLVKTRPFPANLDTVSTNAVIKET